MMQLGGTTTTAATSAAPPPSNDSAATEAAAAAATVGAFEVSEEMNDRGGFGGNRWPRQETVALLKIRSDMGIAFRDASAKGPLWEEVSRCVSKPRFCLFYYTKLVSFLKSLKIWFSIEFIQRKIS